MNKKRKYILLSLIAATALSALSHHAYAACADFGTVERTNFPTAINNNPKETLEEFERCKREGSDPPKSLFRRGGFSEDIAGAGGGGTQGTQRKQNSSFQTGTTFKDTQICPGLNFPRDKGTPGGVRGGGASECVDIGTGRPTPLLAAAVLALVIDPMTNADGLCILNQMASIDFSAGGGDVCVSANASFFCNWGLGGQLCVKDDGTDVAVPEGFVLLVEIDTLSLGFHQGINIGGIEGTFIPEGETNFVRDIFGTGETDWAVIPESHVYAGPINGVSGITDYAIQFISPISYDDIVENHLPRDAEGEPYIPEGVTIEEVEGGTKITNFIGTERVTYNINGGNILNSTEPIVSPEAANAFTQVQITDEG